MIRIKTQNMKLPFRYSKIEKEVTDMREQEIKLEKVKKSCHTARKLVNVVKILTIIAAVFCLAVGIVCLALQTPIDTAVAQNLNGIAENITFNDPEIGGLLQFSLHTEALREAGRYGLVLAIYCFCATLVCAVAGVIFHLIGKAFKNIEKSGSPFSNEVLASLKKTFITLVILIALLDGLGSGLFLGLFLWCLYNILSYGAALQTEVDEIL